jgi:hypothetical protein
MSETLIVLVAGGIAMASAYVLKRHGYDVGVGYDGDEVSIDTDGDGDGEATFDEGDVQELQEIAGIGSTKASRLEDADIFDAEDVRSASDAELLSVAGIGPSVLERIREDLE